MLTHILGSFPIYEHVLDVGYVCMLDTMIDWNIRIYTLSDFIIDIHVTYEKQRLLVYSQYYKHLIYL